jgi:hypothetical protein
VKVHDGYGPRGAFTRWVLRTLAEAHPQAAGTHPGNLEVTAIGVIKITVYGGGKAALKTIHAAELLQTLNQISLTEVNKYGW